MATELRVSDADRERVAARLASAHGEGRLTLAEYDERVRAAHGARVTSDLTPLTADLPDPDRTHPGAAADRTDPAVTGSYPSHADGYEPVTRRPGLRAAVAVWAFVSVLNVVIWLAVSLGTGDVVYPWWIWVAGPWGLVLAAGALAGRAGAPVPMRCGGGSRRR